MEKSKNGVDVSFVLVAGGSGTRMKSAIPKQFLLLQDKPIFIHAIEAALKTFPLAEIILVMPKDQQELAKQFVSQFFPSIQYKLTVGGETRFHSCQNGLDLVTRDVVMIHDAVRPFINESLLMSLYTETLIYSNAIPAVPLIDSIRRVDKNGENCAMDRSIFRSIQTPQSFNSNKLKESFLIGFQEEFTDDASVFECAGNKINLIEGLSHNIKITQPHDLIWAEAILSMGNF